LEEPATAGAEDLFEKPEVKMKTRTEVLADTLAIMRELRENSDYAGEITEATSFLSDLGFESLDVVILANTMQEQYGQIFPFTEYLTEIGKQEHPDITLGEWVDFIHKHLNAHTESESNPDVK
jgi:acyl carrier protein